MVYVEQNGLEIFDMGKIMFQNYYVKFIKICNIYINMYFKICSIVYLYIIYRMKISILEVNFRKKQKQNQMR